MAASTITRDTWTNDTGTAASPNADGTVLNNTVLQNNIYARIDEMFSGAGSYTTLRFGGLVSVEGGQVGFPATQNPSGSPNVLDDYEEAPWTPTITGTGGSSGQVYSSQTGIYTKIGRLVIAEYDVALSTLGTITGNVQLGGFPFTNGTSIFNESICWDALNTAYICMSAQLAASASAATIFATTAAATSNIAAGILQANLTATSRFRGTFRYMV